MNFYNSHNATYYIQYTDGKMYVSWEFLVHTLYRGCRWEAWSTLSNLILRCKNNAHSWALCITSSWHVVEQNGSPQSWQMAMAESADGNDNAFRQPRHTTVSSCKGPEAAARSDNTNSIGSKSRVATKYRPTVFDTSTLIKTKIELASAYCYNWWYNLIPPRRRNNCRYS